MRIRAKILGSAAIVSTIALNSCTYGIFGSPAYLAVTITPRPISVPVGGTVVLTGVVSNNLTLPQWGLLNAADSNGSVGALTAVSGAANSILYTAPSAPPIYSTAAGAGFSQGCVTVDASVIPPAGSTPAVSDDSVTFFITAPTIAVGISPASAGVSLNAAQQFTGYAVGSVNNALTWQVDGVNGGSVAYGTITAAGLYTAPPILPMTGAGVTITVLSQADPTKSASALVNLQ